MDEASALEEAGGGQPPESLRVSPSADLQAVVSPCGK